MNIIFKKINPVFLVLVLMPFLWMALFGLSQMSANMNGEMINCPFSDHSMSICKMNPLEHIQEWQSMFTTLPVKDAVSVLSLLLVIIALTTLSFWSRYSILIYAYCTYSDFYIKRNFIYPIRSKKLFLREYLTPNFFN
jgi:hypothetical protein